MWQIPWTGYLTSKNNTIRTSSENLFFFSSKFDELCEILKRKVHCTSHVILQYYKIEKTRHLLDDDETLAFNLKHHIETSDSDRSSDILPINILTNMFNGKWAHNFSSTPLRSVNYWHFNSSTAQTNDKIIIEINVLKLISNLTVDINPITLFITWQLVKLIPLAYTKVISSNPRVMR